MSRLECAAEWVVCFVALVLAGTLFGVVLRWLP